MKRILVTTLVLAALIATAVPVGAEKPEGEGPHTYSIQITSKLGGQGETESPFTNPITLTGFANVTNYIGSGSEQYQVQVLWNYPSEDPVDVYDESTVDFIEIGRDFAGNWTSAPYTYNEAGNKTIMVRLYHGKPKGKDGVSTQVANATVIIEIVNSPPVAVDDVYSTSQDTDLAVSAAEGVLANDSDADQDALTATLKSGSGPSYGNLTFNSDGSFTYEPQLGWTGNDSFSYEVSDGKGGSDTASVSIHVLPVLESIEVAPTTSTIYVGEWQQFIATGIYSDSSSVDITANVTWASSDDTVAAIALGNATGLAAGNTGISASLDAVTSNAALLEVIEQPPVVYTITATTGPNGSIDPSGDVEVTEGEDQGFTIAADAGYQIADVVVDEVSVGAVGSYTFAAVAADHTISASFEPIPQVTYTITASAGPNGTITPSGDVEVAEGDNQGFTIVADAGYQIADVVVDEESVGAVDICVFINVMADHTISASFEAVPTVTYTITASAGPNGTITPSGDVEIAEGEDQGFTIAADAGYQIDDVVVDEVSVGAVDSYTFVDVTADHTISASFEAVPGPTPGPPPPPTVPVIAILRIAPVDATIEVGGNQQFTATGIYSDSTTGDVTSIVSWVSSDAGVATVAAGNASGLAVGSTQITATNGFVTSNAATLNVTAASPATAVSIEVKPGNATVDTGESVQFDAIAAYSDGNTANVTAEADWISSDPDIASVSEGLASGLTAGTVEITASIGGIESAPAELTVNPPSLVSLAVSPGSASIEVGESRQYTATATYSDGSTADVTAEASWSTSDNSVASASAGLISGLAEGTVTVRAELDGAEDSADLEVTPPHIVSISVTLAEAEIDIDGTQQLTATATYSDGSSAEITAAATWSSSNTDVATVSAGTVTGKSAGTANIQCSLDGVTSNVVSVTVLGQGAAVAWWLILAIVAALAAAGVVTFALRARKIKGSEKPA